MLLTQGECVRLWVDDVLLPKLRSKFTAKGKGAVRLAIGQIVSTHTDSEHSHSHKLLVLLNVVICLVLDWFARQNLRFNELWPVRASIASGLLLFDNLIVLWWYAHRTEEIADGSEQQHRLALTQHREANKPIVVIDRKRVPELEHTPQEHVRYVVRNIGPGLAVNVFFVQREITNRVDGRHVGPIVIQTIWALEAHGERSLSERIEQPLRDAQGRALHFVIVAEGLATRFREKWMVTANVLSPSGKVMHRVLWLPVRQKHDRLPDWLERHWEQIERALAVAEVEGGR